jgi:hypothetical protein
MKLGGRTWSRQELEARVGSVAQLGGARWCELLEGRGRGMRTIEVDAASGLSFSILPDRGMGIGRASWRGIPLAFFDAAAEAHPAFFDPAGVEWIRGFYAGLLTTCGLGNLGSPGPDGAEDLGQHGRIAHAPAAGLADLSGWEGDDFVTRIRGTLEEGVLFGDRLRLVRTISVRLGESSLRIEDEVTNVGYGAAPFVILYHVNPGFPLLDEGTALTLAARSCAPYDEHSREGFSERFSFGPPREGWREQNFLHTVAADSTGAAHAILTNARCGGGIALTLSFSAQSLPYLSEWKSLAPRDYVVGLEPCNAPVRNRAELRRRGELPILAPGESRRTWLEIGVMEGSSAIEQRVREIGALAPAVREPADPV